MAVVIRQMKFGAVACGVGAGSSGRTAKPTHVKDLIGLQRRQRIRQHTHTLQGTEKTQKGRRELCCSSAQQMTSEKSGEREGEAPDPASCRRTHGAVRRDSKSTPNICKPSSTHACPLRHHYNRGGRRGLTLVGFLSICAPPFGVEPPAPAAAMRSNCDTTHSAAACDVRAEEAGEEEEEKGRSEPIGS